MHISLEERCVDLSLKIMIFAVENYNEENCVFILFIIQGKPNYVIYQWWRNACEIESCHLFMRDSFFRASMLREIRICATEILHDMPIYETLGVSRLHDHISHLTKSIGGSNAPMLVDAIRPLASWFGSFFFTAEWLKLMIHSYPFRCILCLLNFPKLIWEKEFGVQKTSQNWAFIYPVIWVKDVCATRQTRRIFVDW